MWTKRAPEGRGRQPIAQMAGRRRNQALFLRSPVYICRNDLTVPVHEFG